MEEKKYKFEFTSASLHILAMLFMLCDHTCAALAFRYRWLTCIGRISFPIFAFLIVEGFFHTSNFKKYLGRLFIFALISEIPFDIMYSGTIFSIYHQNVLWTFIIALIGIYCIEKVKKKENIFLTIFISIISIIICMILGIIGMTDFFGNGVLMVFVFYFFHKRSWWGYLGQFLAMYWINIELVGGFYYPVNIFGIDLEIMEQSFAMLSLIPIWLYHGKQGYHKKWFKYFCYSFYPIHLLVLGILQTL